MPKRHEINLPDVVAEVRAVFDRYETALTENDVPVLEELFWNSPHTTRYGVGENLYGWEAISAFRRARTTGPFRRSLTNTTITTYGRDFATANTEYRREGHDRPGRETKTLLRTPEGWRIVSAHVSLLGETV
ncbi:oxalurate catabolism protein HpxZ [Rhodovulum sp. 12E13]|uniref:oxalurate catabolism protein HpxZ n=1 Tax=Rhodovulum sp. 12E13 TaxID=2203891 RepID=UPI000E190501|nr:oxalurate catabolism protein HpxZ [Rhodovulum sp. 12E13]RDC75397.1 oxalurate catabolism protein HpxZ [Rhodovulum sp. 12E13]